MNKKSEHYRNKRQRGKNFSTEEEVELVKLVENYKNILENKQSNAVTWRQKKQTWEKLAYIFARKTGFKRPWKGLRDKYVNLKRKTRQEFAEEKREINQTGGDQKSSYVSNLSERIAALIGEQATWLGNNFDSNSNDTVNSWQPKTVRETENITQTVLKVEDSLQLNSEELNAFQNIDAAETSSLSSAQLKTTEQKHSLEEEKIILTQLLQKYYEDENERAAAIHKIELQQKQKELKAIELKNELLELEIQEKKQRLRVF